MKIKSIKLKKIKETMSSMSITVEIATEYELFEYESGNFMLLDAYKNCMELRKAIKSNIENIPIFKDNEEIEIDSKSQNQNLSENETGLKLFIFENVSCDWTCGMIVIAAKDKTRAKELFKLSTVYESGYDDKDIKEFDLNNLKEEKILACAYGGS